MKKNSGFTFIELILVLVIISSILLMSINYFQQKTIDFQIQKTSEQLQAIINAASAYYVDNKAWPADIATLQSKNYLPANATIISPYNSPYILAVITTNQLTLNVFTALPTMNNNAYAKSIARRIAQNLPLGYYWGNNGGYWVGSYVNVPGQNLNRAAALNFAGIYHHGGCIPVPTCQVPTDKYGNAAKPQVFVVPVSISGLNDPNSNAYPLTGFTAYALGSNPLNDTPPLCPRPVAPPATTSQGGAYCYQNGSTYNSDPANTKYWRACVRVTTSVGSVADTRTDLWGKNVTVAAFTRCPLGNTAAGNSEPSGSSLNVFGN